MKIVIHTKYGGFSLPTEFQDKYPDTYSWDIDRNDPRIIEAYELGWFNKKSYNMIDIPDDHTYVISDYDGIETVYHAKELYEDGELVTEKSK